MTERLKRYSALVERNLNPTPAAVVAMNIYGKEYSEQRGGVMDFWGKLSQERKNYCEHFAAHVIAAAGRSR